MEVEHRRELHAAGKAFGMALAAFLPDDAPEGWEGQGVRKNRDLLGRMVTLAWRWWRADTG